MRHCAKGHTHISWDDDVETCPMCITIQHANYEAKVDADIITRLKIQVCEMKERCICGKLAK